MNRVQRLYQNFLTLEVKIKTCVIMCFLMFFTSFLSSCKFTATDLKVDVNDVTIVMKAIPTGQFHMGCGPEDEPCNDSEWYDFSLKQKQKLIWVNAFYLAETETTWSLYELCIKNESCPDNTVHGGDNGWGKGQRPIVEISYNNIVESFLPWLNQKTGKDFRLPTESEWEYAARAGSQSKYSWGNDINCEQARYGYVSGDCSKQVGTVPVKSFSANKFGLYDMHGNVWEFVNSCWNFDPLEVALDPLQHCQEIVLRGGSWLNSRDKLRSAARFHHNRTYKESGDGFRLALDID